MVPKWFDKSPAKTPAENVDDLRASLVAARKPILEPSARTAFGHFAAHYANLIEAGARNTRNALTACYGPAVIDRAVLDALCRAEGLSVLRGAAQQPAGNRRTADAGLVGR